LYNLNPMQRFFLLAPYLLSLYLIVLTWLSLTPAKYYRNFKFQFVPSDSTIHFLMYLILSILLFLTLLRFERKPIKLGIATISISVAIGILMEILQLSFVSLNRSFEWKDVMMNFLGSVLGALICIVVFNPLKLKNYEQIQ
jgi:VanZ family protein